LREVEGEISTVLAAFAESAALGGLFGAGLPVRKAARLDFLVVLRHG
jgi:hypothetical protein